MLDNKQILLALFLDLCKAFDTLDHNILLDNLYNYGIRGVLLNWFKSYLSNRKQYVILNQSKSDLKRLDVECPKDPFLAHYYFLIYKKYEWYYYCFWYLTIYFICSWYKHILSGNNLHTCRLVANFNIELEKYCPMAECKQINLKYK